MESNDKGSGALLLWMLARDCRAIIELKTAEFLVVKNMEQARKFL